MEKKKDSLELASDLLRGADAIAEFVFGEPNARRLASQPSSTRFTAVEKSGECLFDLVHPAREAISCMSELNAVGG